MPIRGLIGKKIGTSEIFRDDGAVDGVTAVQVGPCVVTQVKTVDKDGYDAVQLGYDEVRSENSLVLPLRGHLKPTGKLFKHLVEFDVDNIDEFEIGQQLDVSLFEPGDRVNATGFSKGRGFAGGVKRHGFKGGPKTHGQSDRHRAPGSIGAGTTPGRVLKGHRMPGHMGDRRVTVRNLEVVVARPEENLLLIKGGLPGAHKSLLLIRKTEWKR